MSVFVLYFSNCFKTNFFFLEFYISFKNFKYVRTIPTYEGSCSIRFYPNCGSANNYCDNRNESCAYGIIDVYHGDFCKSVMDYISYNGRINI